MTFTRWLDLSARNMLIGVEVAIVVFVGYLMHEANLIANQPDYTAQSARLMQNYIDNVNAQHEVNKSIYYGGLRKE